MPDEPATDAAVSERVVLAMVEAINRRDLDALDGLLAPDFRRHSAATPGVVVESLEGFKQFLRQDLATVPDSRQQVEEIFASGNRVAVRATYRGTQSGPMGPFPASGRTLELPFIAILRLHQGKIAEMWVEWDNVTALIQLGHMKPPAGPS